jgi:proteasome lid subunit RPN8/RPN11
MNLVINKGELDRFKRRATRRYPNEHLEALWGRVDGSLIYVERIVKIRYTDADSNELSYEAEDIMKSREEAKSFGLIWLGTIHTHCGMSSCSHNSNSDNLSALALCEKVFGVLHLWKKDGRLRSEVSWSLPTTYV